jgi:phosphate transport system protein
MLATQPDSAKYAQIQGAVQQLFAMVREGLAAATSSFLTGDRDEARRLVAGDPLIDALQTSVEALVQSELDALAEMTPHEVRLLVSILRIVPELERSGDLVEHIALRTQRGLVAMLTPSARGIVEQMGALGGAMWAAAGDAWRSQDAEAVGRLRLLDDRMDDLHVRLTAELASTAMPVAAAIEMGLVARFFERLGDHAVNVARRIGYCVVGQPVTTS